VPHDDPTPVARPRADAGRIVVRAALVGATLVALLVLGDLQRGGGSPLGLIQPGRESLTTPAIEEDFPDLDLPDGQGLDGQITYTIARTPFRVDASAEHLGRPRYRLQRALLPWVAGALQPGVGGDSLIWTLLAVSLATVAVGAWAMGDLSRRWGGTPWLGLAFPLLPGVFMALRVTTTDAAGIGLALLACALAARHRTGAAVAVGALAVLTKEPSWLILAGWALAHRTPRHIAVAVIPGAVGAAWMIALRVLVPGTESLNGDIGLPFVGLFRAARDIWFDGHELWGLASTLGALALAVVALRRSGLGHPLGWAVTANLAFLLLAGPNPLGTSFGGTRTALALMAVALIAVATPTARVTRTTSATDVVERDPAPPASSPRAERPLVVSGDG
jgi:hypothetical protein